MDARRLDPCAVRHQEQRVRLHNKIAWGTQCALSGQSAGQLIHPLLIIRLLSVHLSDLLCRSSTQLRNTVEIPFAVSLAHLYLMRRQKGSKSE
jgi:hypothetical protein